MNDIAIKESFFSHIQDLAYPCVMAKALLLKGNIRIIMADTFCPAPLHVQPLLQQIYQHIDELNAEEQGYHSIAILFRQPVMQSEDEYESLFWPYLQALHALDSGQYNWDPRVSADPASSRFSFSLKGEAFYVIGMHNSSSRKARRTIVPAIILNPHRQFEALRRKGNYTKIRDTIRSRDIVYSGSQNPMLENFGDEPEVYQYTGKQFDKENWTCPFQPLTAIP